MARLAARGMGRGRDGYHLLMARLRPAGRRRARVAVAEGGGDARASKNSKKEKTVFEIFAKQKFKKTRFFPSEIVPREIVE